MISFLIFLYGLIIGSFLNVCIYRIPRGESVVSPPSHCPSCGRRLRVIDLVPVFSYLFLKGRCRSCQVPISSRYMWVELLTGLLFWLVYLQVGFVPQLINYLLLLSILLVVTFIDLEHYLIPNRVLAVGAILQLGINFFTHQLPLTQSFLGALVGGGVLILITMLKPAGMGGGDIKLLAMLGLFLGSMKVILAFFLASIFGAVIGLGLMALRIKGRKDMIPFGPFLALGGLMSLFWGQQIFAWYVGLLF